MAEEFKVECPVCENEVGTKEDGTLIRAHKVAGQRCGGSDEPVTVDDDVASTGLEKGDPFDELESSTDDGDESSDGDSFSEFEESQTSVRGIASSVVPEFVHVVVVANPCPYLCDDTWHHQNIKMAAVEAQRAGHVLAGAEAKFVDATEQGDKVVLRYSVAVK